VVRGDEGVPKIDHLRCRADRLVELLRVRERPIGIAGVMSVIDATAFDVEEVTCRRNSIPERCRISLSGMAAARGLPFA
jgi:hypothetical protein